VTTSANTETTELPPQSGLAASVGRAAFEMIDSATAIYGLFVRTLYYIARARTDRNAVVRQMYEIGNRSVFLLTVVIGFIGMIFVLQAGLQMQRVIPDLTMLGASFLELLVRDLAASIVALMLASPRKSGPWSSPNRSTRCACAPPIPSTISSNRGFSPASS
jgi:phospholipid/cholesterol/gamma-HCH transport system permease protein